MRQFYYRTLPKTFDEDIYIFDIDKTYLKTNFETIRGILKVFFESSIDKRAIPGVKKMLLEIRKGAGEGIRLNPIYFISASPVKLKRVLEGKLLIDGIQHDGIVLKDYRRMQKEVGKLRLKKNFTYKLVSLMRNRINMPVHSKEFLFGDDYEKDADVYSLYAKILSGHVDDEEIRWHLKREALIPNEVSCVINAMHAVQKHTNHQDIVQKIFIHMIRKRPVNYFSQFGDLLIPTHNYLQTAAILFEMGKISKQGFYRIANSFNLKYPADGWTLQKSLKDLQSRGLLSESIYNELSLWK